MECLVFLQAPKKRPPHFRSNLSEVSDLLSAAIQFVPFPNTLTQGYVGCILQGVASFQSVNDTKSYGAHGLFPGIQKKRNK